MGSKQGMYYRILSKVHDELSNSCQDPQMGLGAKYFDDLIEFVIGETEKELRNANCVNDVNVGVGE